MTLHRVLTLALALQLFLAPPSTASSAAEPQKHHSWPKVELYTTDWCPYCLKARIFFDSRGIPYTLYDVEKSREAAFKKERIAPRSGVPLVIIGDIVIRGYSEKAYKTALELDDELPP